MPAVEPGLELRPHNAARRFSEPAKVVKTIVSRGMVPAGSNVLEVGAGCLRNASFLIDLGCQVTVVECKEIQARFQSEYTAFLNRGGLLVEAVPDLTFDVVLATFVLETICPAEKRYALLRQMVRALRQGGVMALALRGVSDVKTAKARGRPYLDGYITPAKTFIRPYTVPEIRDIMSSCGLSKVEVLARVEAPQIVNLIAAKGTS